ncbi:MAG: hypothetical protein M3Q56_04750 [Bacteroidota bacterium]|nr:hypothetical protein [Bacteroidota bacterium]
MNKLWSRNILRFVILILLQVFVLREINLSSSQTQFIYVIIYPLAILLLPVGLPQFFVLLISFITGFIVDAFYTSPGVHAGACLWLSLARPLALKWLEPKSGYGAGQYPTGESLGIFWFMKYMSTLMIVFFFFYFTLEIFTFVYLSQILLKTILSFIVSVFLIFLLQILFNPKY